MSKPGDRVQKKWRLLEELGHVETMLGGQMTVRNRLSGALKPMEILEHADLLIERLTLGIENGLRFPPHWFLLARATTKGAACGLVVEEWTPIERDKKNGEQFLFAALSVLGPQGIDGLRFLTEYGLENEVAPQEPTPSDGRTWKSPLELRAMIQGQTRKADGKSFDEGLRVYFGELLARERAIARERSTARGTCYTTRPEEGYQSDMLTTTVRRVALDFDFEFEDEVASSLLDLDTDQEATVAVRLTVPPGGGLFGSSYEGFCIGGTVLGSAVVTDPGPAAARRSSVGQEIKIRVRRGQDRFPY